MKINIVTVRSGWILQKIAERIIKNAPDGVGMLLCHEPRRNENNFYVDITNCYIGQIGGKHVGLFTHIDENNIKNVPDLWFTLDYIVHMNQDTFNEFCWDSRFHVFKPKMSYMMPGEIPKGFKYKKPTIGIFQRGKYEGKGFNLMMELADTEVVKSYDWIFAGNDWGPVVKKLKKNTNTIEYPDNHLIYPEGYLIAYSQCDYVLIPSKWEGGPMSLIEAAALGKKIIASEVGWVNCEIPVDYLFINGDTYSLSNLLYELKKNREKAYKVVKDLSYKKYSKYIVDIFRNLS